MENIFLSIIIPVYRAEKNLDRLLGSILACQDDFYEVILVDDGAKDNSPQICDKYSEKYKNISVIHKENGGVSSARNTGLTAARGKYITFADSDDRYVDIGFLKAEISKMENENIDIAFFPFTLVYSNRKKDRNLPFDGVLNRQDIAENIGIFASGSINCVWNKIFRKDIITANNITFPAAKIGEDGCFSFSYFNHCEKYYFSSRSLYLYWQNENSATHSYYKNRWAEEVRLIEMVEKFLIGQKISESETKKIISNKYRNALLNEMYNMLNSNCPLAFSQKRRQLIEHRQQFEKDGLWEYITTDDLPKNVGLQVKLLKNRMTATVLVLMKINNIVKNKK